MTATLTFHPLGNADCTRFDLADGKKLLIDYADMRNPDDRWDRRIDLPAELRSDLRAAQRDYYNVVGYTHLDDDHCRGSGDFFWFEHAAKYQTKTASRFGNCGSRRPRSLKTASTTAPASSGRKRVTASRRAPASASSPARPSSRRGWRPTA